MAPIFRPSPRNSKSTDKLLFYTSTSTKLSDLIIFCDTSIISYRRRSPNKRELEQRYFESPALLVIPTTYSTINSSLSPGAVAGIVLGSVGGILILFSIIYVGLTQINHGKLSSASSSKKPGQKTREKRKKRKNPRSSTNSEQSEHRSRSRAEKPMSIVPSTPVSQSVSRTPEYRSEADVQTVESNRNDNGQYSRDAEPRSSDELGAPKDPSEESSSRQLQRIQLLRE